MTIDEFERDHLERARAFAGEVARRLVGRVGLRHQDRLDVEQELLARLLGRLDRYDARRGPVDVFLNLVIDSAAANLLRDRRAGKRRRPPTRSLDIRDYRGQRTVDALRDARLPHRDDDLERLERAIDAQTVLRRMTAEERRVAGLVVGLGARSAAQTLGVTRDQVRARLLESRERLRGRGF